MEVHIMGNPELAKVSHEKFKFLKNNQNFKAISEVSQVTPIFKASKLRFSWSHPDHVEAVNAVCDGDGWARQMECNVNEWAREMGVMGTSGLRVQGAMETSGPGADVFWMDWHLEKFERKIPSSADEVMGPDCVEDHGRGWGFGRG
ncbi:hypothetical protein EV702DRAFT_1044159 [Suillus placidus]|uniref:Uncharacterized protein n=1 Tax=Suillus placidus TaxID=48579 RepID=A0A9P6ZY30_9AGAM|nr:hypothetical protein EV702DRAFT_1044159 [Suillus placidus]